MSRKRLVLLAMPCTEVVEVPGVLDVFVVANRCSSGGHYDVEIVSSVSTVCSWPGMRLVADRPYRSLRGPIDTLIVTGIDGPDDARVDPKLAPWLGRTAPRCRRIVGLCTGSFVLAEAGLLDGRRATTHWAFCDELARRYPRVDVQPDPIYVRDGNILTSAGSTAGLDLALALVQEDMGRRVALRVAQWMVFFLQRPGGQAQFSAQLKAQMASKEPIRDLQAWMLDHPHSDLSVETLARRVAMSSRTFFRVFQRETGVTPGRFVERVRVDAARRLLEESSHGVEDVASRCGFGSAETMRVAFQRTLRVSPNGYRSRFSTARLPRTNGGGRT